MTASMNWYRMSDSIQSVRVMGVVDSFLMMPFCRSSVSKFTVPNRLRRHHRHRDDAGNEELDEPVFPGEYRFLGRPDERRHPGHLLVYPGEHCVQDFHLRGHRRRAGVVYIGDGDGCVGVVEHHPLHEGPFKAFGNNEDKVHLVVPDVLRGVDGRVDPGYLELPVELEGLDGLLRTNSSGRGPARKGGIPRCPGS